MQVAVLPLSKKLEDKAEPLYKDLKRRFRADYDATGGHFEPDQRLVPQHAELALALPCAPPGASSTRTT